MNNHSLFVTGTDTGIGKTTVAMLLVSALVHRGYRVGVMKPVETGCERGANGELVAHDAELLRAVSNAGQPINAVVPYRYATPVAPHVAAQLEQRPIDCAQLQQKLVHESNTCSVLVVEGAGGLLVPILEDYTYADFAHDCALPTVLVVGSRLGALNHAALTFEVLRARELDVVGYVFNDLFAEGDEEDQALMTNRKMLREIAAQYEIDELCCLSRLSKGDDPEVMRALVKMEKVQQFAAAVESHLNCSNCAI